MISQNPVFIPGPTNMPEVLRKSCDMPTLDHRSAAFADILHPALEGVKKVLKTTSAEVFVFPSTGTGGWETALTNTLSPGDTVLVGRNGMFSHRWIDMCERHGLDVIVLDTAWGQGLPVDRYGEVLAQDTEHRIKAVLATHNETATGVVSDIAGLRAAMDASAHPALLLVDGVSSIGSMNFEMDAWGVDIAVTGSQKGYAVNGYPYTPPVGLLNGLKLACDMLLEEGLENVFARHRRIADGVRAAVAAWGLELCAERPEWQSDTVSAVRTPEGFDAGEIVTHAAEVYDMAFGVGMGEVAGKVFRIGHLGMLTEAQALCGLATVEMCMVDLGLDIQLGSGVAAAQGVYRHGTRQQAMAAE